MNREDPGFIRGESSRTTNYPELLDPALQRPGRFDRVIRVEPPTDSEQEAYIYEKFSEYLTQAELFSLSKSTRGQSRAVLSELKLVATFAKLEARNVYDAIIGALNEIRNNEKAFKKGDYRWKRSATNGDIGFVR